jgi:hypothetical protein
LLKYDRASTKKTLKRNLKSNLKEKIRYNSEHFNIVIFVDIYNLPFYAINMDAVSLLADLSFWFLAIMNIVYFVKKRYELKNYKI